VQQRHLTTEELSALLDGEAPRSAEAQMGSHLADCARCQAEYDGLRQTAEMVGAMPAAPLPRDFRLTPSLLVKVTTAHPSGPARLAQPAPLRALAGLVAMIAVVLFMAEAVALSPMAVPAPMLQPRLEPDVGRTAPDPEAVKGTGPGETGAENQLARPGTLPVPQRAPPAPASSLTDSAEPAAAPANAALRAAPQVESEATAPTARDSAPPGGATGGAESRAGSVRPVEEGALAPRPPAASVGAVAPVEEGDAEDSINGVPGYRDRPDLPPEPTVRQRATPAQAPRPVGEGSYGQALVEPPGQPPPGRLRLASLGLLAIAAALLVASFLRSRRSTP
jgi:hypothetical protein